MFDLVEKKIHDTAIKLPANISVNHTIENGGKCKRKFVKSLVNQAQSSVSILNITQHDIKHKVGGIKRPREHHKVSSFPILQTESNELLYPTVGPSIGFKILGSAAGIHVQAKPALAAALMTDSAAEACLPCPPVAELAPSAGLKACI